MIDDLLQYQWVIVRDFDRALRFYIEMLGLDATRGLARHLVLHGRARGDLLHRFETSPRRNQPA